MKKVLTSVLLSTLVAFSGSCDRHNESDDPFGNKNVDPNINDPIVTGDCGNGVLDDTESCDTAITAGEGACPVACDDGSNCTADSLSGSECSTRCEFLPITSCDLQTADGCCPENCDNTTDADCASPCGNGFLDSGELCDTAIATGTAGACPTACDDGNSCTQDSLKGKDCLVSCEMAVITQCTGATKDGCCANGCDANSDADCSASCGNGIVETGENCDTAIPDRDPGGCPANCDDKNACTTDVLTGGGCGVACSNVAISQCLSAADGCCPSGCNANSDPDCSVTCGNGVLESGETCDTAIADGQAGACPTACADDLACTNDILVSAGTCSATCSNPAITQCDATKSDNCCPGGCDAN